MKIKTVASVSIFVMSLIISPNLLAGFSLDKDASQVNFISMKNGDVAESHSFDDFSGTLSNEGKLQININLVSVNTLIPIRDERIRKMLFDVSTFAVARFTAEIDGSLTSMPLGKNKNVSINGLLTIKDTTVPSTFFVNVTSLKDGKINATTITPTVIDANKFGLNDGINALQTVAKLKSISKSIPLSFSVTFQP